MAVNEPQNWMSAIDWKSNKRINQRIPGIGRVLIDHHLPFLVLYRKYDDHDEGTEMLATTEASFLIAYPDKNKFRKLREFVRELEERSLEKFGTFMLVEVWSRRPAQIPVVEEVEGLRKPSIRLFSSPENATTDAIMDRLQSRLRNKTISNSSIVVEIPKRQRDFSKRPSFLLGKDPINSFQIGIEVEPVYRDQTTEALFPVVLRNLRNQFSKALRYTLYHFIRQETAQRPQNFNVLGRQRPGKVVWEIDSKIDEISGRFDFLLSINPINVRALWAEFKRSNYERIPVLRYRPLQVDVSLAKRTLFYIPIEKVEDPSLAHLFTEKQEELDRQLTMLKERGTQRFMLGGFQMYGRITAELVRKAEEILERVQGKGNRTSGGKSLSAEAFRRLAESEVTYYRSQWNDVTPTVRFSKDMMVGLMVSRGNLLIRPDLRMSQIRANALIQHEIGTHMVTWFNGKSQPLTQLRSGLASYEELQEGIAVLAEYLVGGLNPMRLRTLAARVLAAHSLVEGATFIDTFRFLCRYGFNAEQAFNITLRVYRGGGYIKDCIYLRGFEALLKYLAAGNSLEHLFVGKIALKHLGIIDELLMRKVIHPPRLMPRYLKEQPCLDRLDQLKNEIPIYELVNG